MERERIEPRSYQQDGIQNLTNLTKEHLKQWLTADKGKLGSMLLVEMATGTGKTATVGAFVDKMVALRNRFARMYNKPFPLSILVVNDRINLVNQLHQTMFEGDAKKAPLLSPEVADSFTHQVYHSDSDDNVSEWDEDVDYSDDIGEVKHEDYGTGSDVMIFTTFQTLASSPELFADREYHIIIVDEAHKIWSGKFFDTLMQYYKPNDDDKYPLLIAMSATADKIKHLVWHTAILYGLVEYLASGEAPSINYSLIAKDSFSPEELKELTQELHTINEIQSIKDRKKALQDFEDKIQEGTRLADWSNEQLVDDFLERVPYQKKTIIYAKSIDDANDVVYQINKKTGQSSAIAMHSQTKQSTKHSHEKLNAWKK